MSIFSWPRAKLKSMDALPAKKWTVLVYQGGVNNLDSHLRANLKELADAQKYPEVDVLVRQVDGQGDSRDFRVEGQQLVPVGNTRPQVNSADPAHLAEFVKWGIAQYPSQHYALVVSSHGQGANGVIEDERHGQLMPMAEFARALEAGGRRFDLVVFDACRMQTVEVASELRGRAEVAVGSMDRVGSHGFDPAVLLGELARGEDARTVARRLVENNQPRQLEMFGSLSAVDLQATADLEEALAGIAQQFRQLDSETAHRVRHIATLTRRALPSPGYLEGLDNMAHSLLGRPRSQVEEELQEWLAQVRPAEPVAVVPLCEDLLADDRLPESLKSSLREVLSAEQRAVLAYRGEGLSVRLPIERHQESSETTFDRATDWQRAVAHIVPTGTAAQLPPTWLEGELSQG